MNTQFLPTAGSNTYHRSGYKWLSQWYPRLSDTGLWAGWFPSAAGQPAVREASWSQPPGVPLWVHSLGFLQALVDLGQAVALKPEHSEREMSICKKGLSYTSQTILLTIHLFLTAITASSALGWCYANHFLASQKTVTITSELWFYISERPEFESLAHFSLLWKAAVFCCLFSTSIPKKASTKSRSFIRGNGFSDIWTRIFAALNSQQLIKNDTIPV